MARGRCTKIISMTKWIRTSRLSIKNSVSLRLGSERENSVDRIETNEATISSLARRPGVTQIRARGHSRSQPFCTGVTLLCLPMPSTFSAGEISFCENLRYSAHQVAGGSPLRGRYHHTVGLEEKISQKSGRKVKRSNDNTSSVLSNS